MSGTVNLKVLADAEAVANKAAEYIAKACADAVAAHGSFHWVLAGGSTPRRCYELLRSMSLDWEAVHVYFGDERCLPAGHSERNDSMADAALFRHVPVPPGQIHRIVAELGPEQGAENYTELLKKVPKMDLVMLGMGEDGHTASLFPGQPGMEDSRLAIPVHGAPKPPAERVSVGLSVLNAAHQRMILVTGAGKLEALTKICRGEPLPAGRIHNALWLVDRAAAGLPPQQP